MIDGDAYGRLLRHARRVCPPDPAIDAEDLLQSAWLRTLSLRAADPERDHTGLLYRAVTQAAIDAGRRFKRRQTVPLVDDWVPDRADMEGEALARVALAPYLRAAPNDPTLLTIVLLGVGYSQREIAATLGVDIGTVGTRAYRWRQRAALVAEREEAEHGTLRH